MDLSNPLPTPAWLNHPDSHFDHLANNLPQWLLKASAKRRTALGKTAPRLREEFRNASAGQHLVLKRLNAAYWTAQNRVDERLEHLQDARAFGEPLLRATLKQRYGLDLDVKTTFLRLYIPASIPWFPIKSGAARTWTVSLLDAALHNFELSETRTGAYEPDSTFITQPSASGQFETLNHIKDTLTIAAFTALCRELDLGAKYQAWLEDNLGVSNPVAAAVLRPPILESQKAALRMALELALLQKDTLKEDAYRSILGIVSGVQGMMLNGKTLLCHDLTMMSARLTGIVLFAPDLEQYRGTERVIAYIPDDPRHPIKEYPSSGHFMAELSEKLRANDYQQFFSRFIDHADRGYFFANLNSRLTQITWHPRASGDPLPSWRESPANHVNLQFSATPISGDLWQHLYQRKLDKILNDARTLAVSTASADRKARWQLWDSFTNIASTLLQVAAFVVLPFVPVLGEMMMAYMVYQMLDEAFESIVEWSQNLTRQALEHTLAFIESIVQLGAFAAGGSLVAGEFRNIVPKECVDFIDRFLPVKSAAGKTRYWNGDLKPYEQNIALSADSNPDALGLHTHAGKKILPLDSKHYAVTRGSTPDQFHIEHPTRIDAYKPRLKHNRNGAWHTELEQPLKWDRRTLLQRLGHAADSLSEAECEQVLRISGHHENAVRRMHADHEPLPPLLADTLTRFRIDKGIRTFIERIGSEHPETYTTADPTTQLQLLTENFPWPANKGLRLIDGNGEVLWQYAQGRQRTYDIRASSGDVLEATLKCLTEDEIKALFEESFGAPTLAPAVRAKSLRSRIAEIAQSQRHSLLDARYRAQALDADPLAQRLMDAVPGLPGPVAEELLNSATGIEWQQLEEGTVAPRLKELARWAQQQVRAVRARESLELGSRNNPDADRLALHSLPRMPGWSGDVRIEVNRYSFNGENIDSIGLPDAPQRKVLVQLEDGDYQAFDEIGQQLSGAEDFYNGLLRALPDSERKGLNLQTGQGAQLREVIAEHALGHAELQEVLAQQPLRKPYYDPKVMRLPGGTDGYPRIHPGATSMQTYVQTLYPSFNAVEVEAFIRELQRQPSGARVEISRLYNEFEQMSQDLRTWLEATPLHHPQTGALLSPHQLTAVRRNRLLLAEELQRCWRRQTALNDGDMDAGNRGYMFRFTRPIIGELPTIDADFSHIAYLTLEGSETTRGAHAFLRRFTGLRRMEVRNIPLNTLPDFLTSLPNLEQLILSNCAITLSADAQAALASLSQMRTLELYKNPLGGVFSVEAMTQLDYIDLGDTGISSLPPGLLDLPSLETAIFSENQLTELPAQLFQLPASKSEGFDFASNPLSVDTRNQVKSYFKQTRENLGVQANQSDIDRVTALYPVMEREQASDFVYSLPGTLETGRTVLTLLEAEYSTLCDTLAAWSGNLPAVHPLTGEPFSPRQRLVEHYARDEFKSTVEQAWRRETAVDDFNPGPAPSYELNLSLVISGELPTLSADFSHVSHLYLHSYAGQTSVTDGFLKCFPKLKGLTIRDYRLGNIPQSVFNMGELTALVLPDCRISLTADTMAGLAGMEHLDFLDLSHNPLLLTPDVSQMADLSTLALNDTHITDLPPGLLKLKKLDIANLSNNAIRELPSDILELPMETGESINLRGNPFSERSLQLLHAYFRQNGTDFGVEEIIETAEMEVSNSDDSEAEQ
ncbi:dermonecrotic toxin domain-containing protein [Pseudomonas sp. NPDC096950]|uniref:dermonecrotic toxin domain-containing protein n=1 Tax=Pseudomonas sp. NPDC096950 TaxID=3364485 RepID=UPI00383BD4CF